MLVIMRHEGKGWRKAAEIRQTIRPGFPLDLLVRSPDEIEERLEIGDDFIERILDEGVTLYDSSD